MRSRRSEPRRRAERLVRWYPKDWRARYGEEFVELLDADIDERPRSWRRGADVAFNGMAARAASAGLGGPAAPATEQVRRSLATLGWVTAIFLTFGLSLWAQLSIGWQWSAPDTTATAFAMVVMTIAVSVLVALTLLAAAPVAWSVIIAVARGRGAGLVRPSLLFVAGASVMIVGARHFGNGWPGTGGHPWAHQGIVPGGVAAFTWASTLAVSSYWAHPHMLLGFPAKEVVWMAVSPVAMTSVALGATTTIRRLELAPRMLRYEARVATLATLAMAVFLVGAGAWVLYGGPGPRNLFHVGAIDVVGVSVMAVAVVVAGRAVQQADRGRMALPTR